MTSKRQYILVNRSNLNTPSYWSSKNILTENKSEAHIFTSTFFAEVALSKHKGKDETWFIEPFGRTKTLAYVRVSTNKQDLESQRDLLFEYAHRNKIIIDDFIEIETSSRKDLKSRRIDELVLSRFDTGDTLIVPELSRLGRNMLEILNLLNKMGEKGIKITFVRQPELSTTGPHGRLLLAIYRYFAETEREIISVRTKEGLTAAKASGQLLGRPKGSRNKGGRRLDPFAEKIKKYISTGITLSAAHKLISSEMEKPVSYMSFLAFVKDGRIKKEII
jgi:DNA invertase Pin-like site-specific DNA recombinase